MLNNDIIDESRFNKVLVPAASRPYLGGYEPLGHI